MYMYMYVHVRVLISSIWIAMRLSQSPVESQNNTVNIYECQILKSFSVSLSSCIFPVGLA